MKPKLRFTGVLFFCAALGATLGACSDDSKDQEAVPATDVVTELPPKPGNVPPLKEASEIDGVWHMWCTPHKTLQNHMVSARLGVARGGEQAELWVRTYTVDQEAKDKADTMDPETQWFEIHSTLCHEPNLQFEEKFELMVTRSDLTLAQAEVFDASRTKRIVFEVRTAQRKDSNTPVQAAPTAVPRGEIDTLPTFELETVYQLESEPVEGTKVPLRHLTFGQKQICRDQDGAIEPVCELEDSYVFEHGRKNFRIFKF